MNRIDYLRISLLDRCNFRCSYCMPAGMELDFSRRQEWLTCAEIALLVRAVFAPLGFTKFRLTGGEPLLRADVVDVVGVLAALPQTEDLSLTTNAYLLAGKAQALYDAGLRRINISLDSLDPDTFAQIVGRRDRWQQVWDGILAAHRVGFDPLKLNVVVVPGINDDEVLDLAALTLERNWHVRFIEFMPIGNPELFGDRAWVPSEELRARIRARWGLVAATLRGNGPADVFQIPGARGTLGFISQMSECFCDRCNRVRLSADGWLRPCLLNETGQVNLRALLRAGVTTADLRDRVQQFLQQKGEINFKLRDSGTSTGIYARTMSQIGG
ncbi:molybdenum cofactor biosynthesis protein [Rubidibacter lacunae KORDI 51-2]|uniref:GTP 3',8-cyclase n=1 Tax=Rubidibacter lacunae KORDI 51-2 TaxID=582515 RepID=U5DJT0_9CHRO|nr:GTP 3',8-cyclase MoaA [Rubidibacter lacunae]ERN41157.1 molybdenum cofactor biosynthesis protein [Rubidibacter lacunae KORDI 51-2]